MTMKDGIFNYIFLMLILNKVMTKKLLITFSVIIKNLRIILNIWEIWITSIKNG